MSRASRQAVMNGNAYEAMQNRNTTESRVGPLVTSMVVSHRPGIHIFTGAMT